MKSLECSVEYLKMVGENNILKKGFIPVTWLFLKSYFRNSRSQPC